MVEGHKNQDTDGCVGTSSDTFLINLSCVGVAAVSNIVTKVLTTWCIINSNRSTVYDTPGSQDRSSNSSSSIQLY